ncbi:hypothetical protein Btru_017967 [Bulinus truncatus]|nr:hypothetical protein Btru_017967 [Bulinus truncatus]
MKSRFDKGFVVVNVFSACPPGFYGPQCTDQCPQNCADGICTNGFCKSCAPGWKGFKCDKACDFGTYGKDCKKFCSYQCSIGSCDTVTGACTSGCIEGYKPPTCEDTCDDGLYGTNCTSRCSIHCVNKTCDKITGKCSCEVGYTGDTCNDTCQNGFYGANCTQTCSTNCLNQSCDNVNGYCKDCGPGKTGNLCDQACPQFKFGTKCVESCSTNCGGDKSCNPTDGTCLSPCVDGYKGKKCIETDMFVCVLSTNMTACDANTYGAECKSNCSQFCKTDPHPTSTASTVSLKPFQICHNIDGHCLSGCQSGYEGDQCLTASPSTGSAAAGVIAGPIIAIIILLIVALIGFLFWRKRTSKKESVFGNGRHQHDLEVVRTTGLQAKATDNTKDDHSRVHLKVNPEKNQGDYINASFVKSYKNEEKFIASQGPNKLIIEDFVRMLWEQKVDKVVMLTNLMEEGKQKCEQYWPDELEVAIGEFKVKLKTTDTLADFVIRKLEIIKPGETAHFFTQFHFTSWPDRGVPPTPWSLVDFEQRVSLFPSQNPVVVHCSAGVGRTGTFIALHNVICQAKETGSVDFYNAVWKLRQDRVNMVQTVEQYIFLHEAALVAILCADTTVHASEIQEKIKKLETKSLNGQSYFEKEFKAICEVCADGRDSNEDEGSGGSFFNLYINSKSSGNKVKNRFSNILPKDKYRPFLHIDTKDQGDYINAVAGPSFAKLKDQFITQLPLPSTVTDFWRLVAQYGATLIIAFELDTKDKDTTIENYLPLSKTESLQCGSVEIRSGAVIKGSCWEEQTLYLTIQKKKKLKTQSSVTQVDEKTVTHLKYKGTVINTEKLLEFMLYSRSHLSRRTGKVVYTCRNGADFSGLAYVLSLLLDRMDHDHSITVPLVVGAVKTIRQQVIPTLDQYKTLYTLLKLYSESDKVYYNYGGGSRSAANKTTQNTNFFKAFNQKNLFCVEKKS